MAHVGFDSRTHNENAQDVPIKSKQMLTNDTRSIKKQILGERQNVLQSLQSQQVGSTPFKGIINVSQIDGLSGKFSSTSSLCNDVLRKQHHKQNYREAQNKLEQKYKTNVESCKDLHFDEELFNSFDHKRECCKNTKSEAEIWAEMDMMNINFGDHRFNSKIDEDEKDTHNKLPEIFDDFDDILVPPALDSVIDFKPFTMMEFSPILDELEDLSF